MPCTFSSPAVTSACTTRPRWRENYDGVYWWHEEAAWSPANGVRRAVCTAPWPTEGNLYVRRKPDTARNLPADDAPWWRHMSRDLATTMLSINATWRRRRCVVFTARRRH